MEPANEEWLKAASHMTRKDFAKDAKSLSLVYTKESACLLDVWSPAQMDAGKDVTGTEGSTWQTMDTAESKTVLSHQTNNALSVKQGMWKSMEYVNLMRQEKFALSVLTTNIWVKMESATQKSLVASGTDKEDVHNAKEISIWVKISPATWESLDAFIEMEGAQNAGFHSGWATEENARLKDAESLALKDVSTAKTLMCSLSQKDALLKTALKFKKDNAWDVKTGICSNKMDFVTEEILTVGSTISTEFVSHAMLNTISTGKESANKQITGATILMGAVLPAGLHLSTTQMKKLASLMGASITLSEAANSAQQDMTWGTTPANCLTVWFLITATVKNVIQTTSWDLMENVWTKMNFVGTTMKVGTVLNAHPNISSANSQTSASWENLDVAMMTTIAANPAINHFISMESGVKLQAASILALKDANNASIPWKLTPKDSVKSSIVREWKEKNVLSAALDSSWPEMDLAKSKILNAWSMAVITAKNVWKDTGLIVMEDVNMPMSIVGISHFQESAQTATVSISSTLTGNAKLKMNIARPIVEEDVLNVKNSPTCTEDCAIPMPRDAGNNAISSSAKFVNRDTT